MRLLLAAVGLGAISLVLLPAASWGESSATRSASANADSTGAHLLIERQNTMVRVRGAFTNDSSWTGPLTYELDVRRTGNAGTSQSTQSGRFDTAPGQTDTLSTVRVNVQSGDRMDLHLTIRRDETLIDEVRQQRTF